MKTQDNPRNVGYTNRVMKMHELGKSFCFLSKLGARRQPLVVGESESKDREQKDCSIHAFSSRGWYYLPILWTLLLPVVGMASFVDMTSEKGRKRFDESQYKRDYWYLSTYYITRNIHGGGIASGTIALNALDIPRPAKKAFGGYRLFTPNDLLDVSNTPLKGMKVLPTSIKTLGNLLERFPVDVAYIPGTDLTDEKLRQELMTTLNDENNFLIVQMSSKTDDHENDDHIAPIAAYDEASDSVLIMDVMRHDHPPFWVELEELGKDLRDEDGGGLLKLTKRSYSYLSKDGMERLLTSQFQDDYWRLIRVFQTQRNQTFCGVASSVMVMNALDHLSKTPDENSPWYSQGGFFTDEVEKIVPKEEVETDYRGLTLEELQKMLATYGLNSEIVYADKLDVDTFRETLKSVLNSDKSYMLINFFRPTLGQPGAGHFSPVGAYDEASDSVLILDVARFKSPPFWVTLENLVKSMDTLDDSGKPRGYIVIT